MKFQITNHDYDNKWTRWFAWYPVNIVGNKYVWLEWIERMIIFASGEASGLGNSVEYRLTTLPTSKKDEELKKENERIK
jgi:hypothetical protein